MCSNAAVCITCVEVSVTEHVCWAHRVVCLGEGSLLLVCCKPPSVCNTCQAASSCLLLAQICAFVLCVDYMSGNLTVP